MEEWKLLKKNTKRKTVTVHENENKFRQKLQSLFYISPVDVNHKIRSTREKNTAEIDIEWLEKLKSGERLLM